MTQVDNIPAVMTEIGKNARAAAAELSYATAERKQAALISAADAVWANRVKIIEANKLDLDFGKNKGLSPAMMDRLMLDEDRVRAMQQGLRTVADQVDPVGEVLVELGASGYEVSFFDGMPLLQN